MFGGRGLKARVVTMTLSNMKPKVPDEFLSRFVAHIRKRSVACTISRKAVKKNTVITAKTGG